LGKIKLTRQHAEQMDQSDALEKYRGEFYIPKDVLYLDGNSLGLLSKRAEAALLSSLEEWKTLAIEGWMGADPAWFTIAEELGTLTAPLIGAKPEEVIVTGSTTTNLHQLLATFYRPEGKRSRIIADELNFPSDIYAIQSHLALRGLNPEEYLVQVPSRNGKWIDEKDVIASLTDEVALMILPTVLYRSGQLLDIQLLTKEAHERGILVGWDACHSIGAIPHRFHEWGVDFAYWCNYKYLNNGPGGVGGLSVHERHFGTRPGLAGWFGSNKEKQFDMEHTFTPADHAGAYQIGTPHILSMAPLLGSLQMFQEATIEAVRNKSLRLTQFLMDLVAQEMTEAGLTIANPLDDHRRGGHVSLEHPDAARICKALKARGVIPDFRAPNMIRLAPVALYNTFIEVWDAVQILKAVMDGHEYRQYENRRGIIA
jgi:kynureninase